MDARLSLSRPGVCLALLGLAGVTTTGPAADAQRIPDAIVQLYHHARIAIEMEDIESLLPRFSVLLRAQGAVGRGWAHELAQVFQQRDQLAVEVQLDEVEVVGDGAFVRVTWSFTGTAAASGEKWETTQQRADMLNLQDGIWEFVGSDLIDREALETKVNGPDYHDPVTGLSATATDNWRLIPFEAGTKAAVAAWSPDLTAWAIWVVGDLPGAMTAEHVARAELDVMERLGGKLGVSAGESITGEATLGGRPAFRTSRTLVTDDGTEIYTSRTYCVVGLAVYVLVETAIPPEAHVTHQEAFARALASTKIAAPTVAELPPEAGRVEDGVYVNDVYGCKIKAPEGWEVKIAEGQWKLQATMNEPGRESFLILGMVDLPIAGLTAEQAIVADGQTTSEATESFELIEQGETTVGGLPAYQSTARFDLGGVPHQRHRVYLVDEERLFFIIADAIPADDWSELRDTFEEAIQSLELFGGQPVDAAQ